MESKEQLIDSSNEDYCNFYLKEFESSKAFCSADEYRFKWALKKMVKGKSVLDIGCSNALLGTIYDGDYCGLDVHEKILFDARKNCPHGIFFEIVPDKKLSFQDESFDYVVALEVIEHVKDLNLFLKEAYRVLKKGGKLLITTPKGKNRDCLAHINYFDFYSLADTIKRVTDIFVICDIYKISSSQKSRDLFAVEVFK